MHENTLGGVTFLVNLMFSRLDKFDRLIFGRRIYDAEEGGGGRVAYIWDVVCVTYLGGIYSEGGYIWVGVLIGFYSIYIIFTKI